MGDSSAKAGGYGALAWIYDQLNADVDYHAWADFIEACFDRYTGTKPNLVLDLACGTGRMTTELASRGYDMIGIDGSDSMLSEAFMRSENMGILYLCQDMRTFELYGTVGAVTCCLDSLNYLTTEEDFVKAIRNVRLYLEPGGLFLFDMNTPYKFEYVYGDEAYILEDELPPTVEEEPPVPIFCGWQNHYDRETKLCDFWLSMFLAWDGEKYNRYDEHQIERCYTLEEIRKALSENGFELLDVFGDYNFSAPQKDAHRWYFVARAIPGNTAQQVVQNSETNE